ncbi:uncharacterized protein H6S33_006164 [Morchella sextelata]|uniref:uncharacterized protein n=1 Tax=Morchella sextelata TaxID=1174677 RepID=UPI001D04475B|nr:uncharacterized protein H6S33_006164 [Morchella sextelata]KAH0614278.1 hypothetical protein H6S33_006164 [Morchella sextelata]
MEVRGKKYGRYFEFERDRDYRISWEFLMIIGILSSMFWLKTLIFALLSGQAISQSTLLKSNNLTEAIQWDATSLYIDGQPVFIFSGEFHYWRIPNPSLYLDIFQKIRATGYNAISIYFHWGFHCPKDGVFDFETGTHDLQPVFDAAKKAGLWVIARPGPYLHAETTAGGFPGWLINQPLEVRTNDPLYTTAWKEYIAKIGPIIAKNQVTEGGPVILAQIENEYRSGSGSYAFEGADEYMEDLSATYKEVGIVVPIFHNDFNKNVRGGSWNPRNYPGVLDIYGLDSYPRGFDCANPQMNFNIDTGYYNHFAQVNYGGPSFTPEFQGGAFDPWAGPGYEKCAEMVGPEFVDVYYKNNVAQGFTMQSYYMTFGGTNWGHVATPVVYTSYDYGSGITEGRLLRDRANESKLLGLLTRATTSLLHAPQVGNSTAQNYTTNAAVFVTELRNAAVNAGFYVVRSAVTNSTDTKSFSINLETSLGPITVPSGSSTLLLEGRQTKIIPTDYKAGKTNILYSTAEISTWTVIDGEDFVLFYLKEGQAAEIAVSGVDSGEVTTTGSAKIAHKSTNGTLIIDFVQTAGLSVVQLPGATFLLTDKSTAYQFWAPGIKTAYYEPPESHVLVSGPYLVRNATAHGKTLDLVGDINKDIQLEVFANSTFSSITWNGERLNTKKSKYGSRIANLSGPNLEKLKIPSLNGTKWKTIDSLPEIDPDFDDSAWVKADKMNSTNQYFPPKTLPVLYAGEYGYHTGNTIYRGRFIGKTANGTTATGVALEVWGGAAFGYSAWLNGEFLGYHAGTPDPAGYIEKSHPFTNVTVNEEENVLVVLADRMGYERDDGAFGDPHSTKKPRGIRSAILTGGSAFTSWTLQGNVGQEEFDDAVRAPYNEDGLYAERIGAHFSGFDDSKWEEGSPMDGFEGPGVKFYRTTVKLDLPDGWDVPLGFFMKIENGTSARAELFVNGWQFGKYVSDIGPQTMFPVFPGIIHPQGKNTIAIALWGQHDVPVKFQELYLGPLDIFKSGYGPVESEGLTPGYIEGRKKYEIK